MPPSQKVAKACKAMKPYGFPNWKVKAALKELLPLYDNQWELIEDDNYKVLFDRMVGEPKADERMEPEKNEASSSCRAKRGRSKKTEASLPLEPQDSEPLSKRLRPRYKKENSSVSISESTRISKTARRSRRQNRIEPMPGSKTSSETEDCEPLVKKPRRRQQQEQVSNAVDKSDLILTETSVVVLEGKENLLPFGYQEPFMEYLPRHQMEQSLVLVKAPDPLFVEIQLRRDAQFSHSCFEEEILHSTKLYLGGVETESNPVLQVEHAENSEAPKSKSELIQEKGKATGMPQVDAKEVTLSSDEGNDLLCFAEPQVVINKELCPSDNVHELRKNYSKHLITDEPSIGSILEDEVPLDVINLGKHLLLKAPSSLLCGDYSSNGNSYNEKKDDLKIPESRSPNGAEKDEVLGLSQLDIVSSPGGEVKLFFICKSSKQPGFCIPSLDMVVGSLEERYQKLYGLVTPNFSVMEVMRDICQSFLEIATTPTAERVSSMNESSIFDASKKLNVQNIQSDEHTGGSSSRPPKHSCGSIKFQNLIKVRPKIGRGITVSGFGSLHHLASFENRASGCNLKSSSGEAVQKHTSSPVILTPYDYIDDITRGKEKVKISLLNGSNAEKSLAFLYISQNMVYKGARVKFTMDCISEGDCCSHCSKDCLSFSMPCECAGQTEGEFAYAPGGLLKESFLEDCITLNQASERCHYFFCKDCPLERSNGGNQCELCEGHLMRKFIKECWSKCGCSNTCGNRVVQQGISVALQVFQALEGKGWGVRTLEDLPKGAFVCEYAGEVVTCSELDERNKQSTSSKKNMYSVLLDAGWGKEGILKDEEALCLDATRYGNVARFINHRCSDANLIEVPVKVEIPNHHYYHLALFTTRKVAAMEELTWDYGINFEGPEKPFKCQCGSLMCRDSN
ncbi:hypothetical protein SLEP1_g46967 [Rubroshorea leprosula]|uniref:Uncharacterized protein n=1 Tax=Rubroshorea leprosula TaxID=152421 RepID=A0AAV5LNY9_9ROSI|nr:hypothetical protein SLEP1_g46967 [Rubroshorea leprosula]